MIGIDSFDYEIKSYNPMTTDIKLSVKDKAIYIGGTKYNIESYVINWIASQLGLRHSKKIEKDINNTIGIASNIEILLNPINVVCNIVLPSYVKLSISDINMSMLNLTKLTRDLSRKDIKFYKGFSFVKIPMHAKCYAYIGHYGKRIVYECGNVPIIINQCSSKIKLKDITDARGKLLGNSLTFPFNKSKAKEILTKAKRHFIFDTKVIEECNSINRLDLLIKALGDVKLRTKRARRIGTSEQCMLASCALSSKLLGAKE